MLVVLSCRDVAMRVGIVTRCLPAAPGVPVSALSIEMVPLRNRFFDGSCRAATTLVSRVRLTLYDAFWLPYHSIDGDEPPPARS